MNASDLRDLGRHVAEREDDVLDALPEDEDLRQRLAARAARRTASPTTRPRHSWLIAGGLAASAAAGITVVVLTLPGAEPPPPLSFSVGSAQGQLHAWVSAPATAELPLSFSDGSSVVLEPGARGRVVDLTADGAEVVVEQGAADVDVVHRDGSSWRVRSGPFVVHVTGTRFSVNWDAPEDTVTVRLEEGNVRVSGCSLGDEGQPLRAGQMLEASCRAGRTEIGPLSVKAPGPATEVALRPVETAQAELPEATPNENVPASQSRKAKAKRTAAPTSPGWQALARDGRYAEAYAALSSKGRDAEMARAGASDLLLLADTVRLGGGGADASRVYRAVRSRFPASNQAARAAFHLGRFESVAGRSAGAIRWYETYLSEQPSGALAAATLGRLMEEHAHAGDRVRARRTASRYLAAYPGGSHADDARKDPARGTLIRASIPGRWSSRSSRGSSR